MNRQETTSCQAAVNPVRGILYRLVGVLLHTVMAALIRAVGQRSAVGEMVFFRCFFGLSFLLLIYGWRRELGAAPRGASPGGLFLLGLFGCLSAFCYLAALARLPLIDVTTIYFTA